MIKAISNLTNQNTMHTTHVQAPTPAGRTTIFSRTRSLLRRTLVLAILAFGLVNANAQQYVFLYKNGNTVYFLRNNNGSIQAQPDFGSYASTCIWTGSGTETSTFKNGDYFIQRNNGNLRLNASSTTWTIDTYGRPYNYRNYYGSYYIRYNNGWGISYDSPGTGVNYTVLFTYSNHEVTLTNPTITGADVLTTTGTSNYRVAATATPQYHQFDGYNGTTATTYYWYSNALQTSAPSETDVTSGTWSLTGNTIDATTYATVNASNGTITVSSLPPTDLTMALSCTVTSNGVTKKAQKTVVLYASTIAAPTVTRTGNSISLATSSVNAAIYYTTDGSTPTSSSTFYSGPFSIEALSFPVTIKAIAIRNGNNSTTTTQTYNSPVCEMPQISISSAGAVTISCPTEGATIRYTTDGSNPTESTGTVYSGSFNVSNLTTVKAIAYKTNYTTSAVASDQYLTSGTTTDNKVILNDLEDHSWSYYSNPECPIRSLNPADVKITYNGNGTGTVQTNNNDTPSTWGADATTVKVGIDANFNTFVYYKTLERTDGATATTVAGATGRCSYTTIPNPFSVRPTYSSDGTSKYRGFYKWRLKSFSGGSIYTASSGGNALTTGATIDAETEIFFAPTSEYGMEVEFEALWARAYVSTSGAPSNSLGVERNFYVITSSANSSITAGSNPCTYTSIYPNGTTNGTTAANSVTVYKYGSFTASADSKIEYIILRNNNSEITGAGHNLTIGRGVSGYNNGICATTIYGRNSNSNSAVNYTLRIESGTYTDFYLTGSGRTFSSTVSAKCVLGCDYDRADDTNTNLYIANGSGNIYGGKTLTFSSSSNRNNVTFDWLVKSGTYHNDILGSATSGDQSIYLGSSQANGGNLQYIGKRRITVEGGNIASIAGAMNNQSTNYSVNDGSWAVMVRMKGGTVRGSIYGAAGFAWAVGDRTMIFTGGTINGWVAGGCNGTQTGSGGTLDGDTRLYVGGNVKIVHTNSDPTISTSKGGNVFGAGSGYSADYEIGEVNNSTLVLADNAEVSRGLYGGGNYGYVGSGYETNIYILGGKAANVFGGANQRFGQTVNIFMNGGLITDGLYGGSNVSGTINNNVTMQINGGQVGTSSSNANIHGGGYGSGTGVSGNIELTLGIENQTTPGVTVYGDVYGGSADGSVNDATSDHTFVTLNAGTIYGSLYGGGLGINNANCNVNGAVKVTVNGGSVKPSGNNPASIFGCNNAMGSPKSKVEVIINKTGSTVINNGVKTYAINGVYGGGNLAHYSPTSPGNYPTVTINGCESTSIKDVYGGGNAAAVPYTYVTINGGDIYRVFAGGNGESGTPAHVGYMNTAASPSANSYGTGTATADIKGGTIAQVFGGSNSNGTIRGTSNIIINKSTAQGACAMIIGEVYRGGNEAVGKLASITLGCTGTVTAAHSTNPELIGKTLEGIGDLYGGSRKADNTGDISLNIQSGIIGRVFGGNNIDGVVNGNITIDINYDSSKGCGNDGWYIGDVFGGGNQAAYSKTPDVNIINGVVSRCVYGGGNEAGVAGGDVSMTGGSVLKGIYGGCNTSGTVTGNVSVTITGGTVGTATNAANVHGGGYGQDTGVNGNVELKLGADNQTSGGVTVYGDVYGGSADGSVNDATSDHTYVTLNAGTIYGSLYGGGLGITNSDCNVNGAVKVTVNGGSIIDPDDPNGEDNNPASIFGCNNAMGSPKSTVEVVINKTGSTVISNGVKTYAINGVYGGGNLAHYNPTTTGNYPTVTINGCESSIKDVYGGGNAAAVPYTKVTINGGDIYRVFAGGNGESGTPAHVGYMNTAASPSANSYGTGTATADIKGGTIAQVFGGSNSNGTIRGTSNIIINKSTAQGACAMIIGEVYRGGNEAVGKLASITLGCTGTVTAAHSTNPELIGKTLEGIGDLYGGSRKADNTGDISLNIQSGIIGRVFGGNNIDGVVNGNITIDINYDSSKGCGNDGWYIGDVFGGGNQAAYSKTPDVNIINGVVSRCVYGGGNEAGVAGGDITMTGGTVLEGIYGGCNTSGTVSGNIEVNLNAGTVGATNGTTNIVFGGGFGDGTATNGNVTVTVNGSTIHGHVYGGSALGSVNNETSDNTTIHILSGTVNGNIYGGGLGLANVVDEQGTITTNNSSKGQVNGEVIVNIGATNGAQTPTYTGNATINGSVYGCNNTNGSPKANVTVNVYKTAHTEKNTATYTQNDATYAIDQVFGGGNQADYSPVLDSEGGTKSSKRATVHVYTCANTIRRVFGGGNAAAAYGVVTTIDGGRFDYIFGGGNGENNHAANIGAGGTNLTVNSGVINYLFGGSNETGSINGPMLVAVNNTGGNECTERIKNFFAGGNLANIGAPGQGNSVDLNTTIACGTVFDAVYGGSNLADIYGNVTLTINGGTIGEVYAGSKGVAAGDATYSDGKAANIYGNTILNINGGDIGDAFGGSNINGNITGSITVNMDWSLAPNGCNNASDLHIDNVFGASNLATYTPTTPGNYPEVNIKHGTVSGSVFGAGNGDPNDATKGIVTSNPVVTIGDANANHYAIVGGNVYGGGNNAAVSGSTTVTYNDSNASSTVTKLFGGGNAASVSGTTSVTLTSGKVTGGVYGGCNSSGSVGAVTVALNGGTVGASNATADVYGGGYGSATTTTGNIGVTLNGTTIYGDIYGGSALGGVNSASASPLNTTTVTLSSATLHGSVFGGGKGDNASEGQGHSNVAAVSNGNTIVNINVANTNLTGIYGGANARGNVKGAINVNINANVGSSTSTLDIFGGGYGAATNTEGNVTVTIGDLAGNVTPVIYGDIYGGSALGNVNNDANDITKVDFLNGTLKKTKINNEDKGGNIYGGGLGDANNAAKVNGQVVVNISTADQTTANCHIDLRDASIYGGNNTNGSPQDNITVNVYKTAYNYSDYASGDNYTAADGAHPYYAIDQVFGGGNQADYAPEDGLASSTKKTTVHIYGCTNTVRRVFGGGNAAAAVGLETIIDGGRFDYVFGGGNGETSAANIGAGGTNLQVHGGNIRTLFGGSNTSGTITGQMRVNVDGTGACASDMYIAEFFCGNNLAPIGTQQSPTNINATIGCDTRFGDVYGGCNLADIWGNVTLTIVGGTMNNVYGGSKGRAADPANNITAQAADIHGNVTLNIHGGLINQNAYGGSNINGNITGSITVDMDWSQASSSCNNPANLHVGNVYGASNLAAYTPTTPGNYPAVSIKHGTVSGSVFGGGKGAPATVTSNPVVTIGDSNADHCAIVTENVYGGGDAAAVSGNATVVYNDNNSSSTVAKLFGGGNAANVSGTTSVTLTNGKVTGGVYGGCNTTGSVGAVTVALNGGQVGASGAGNEASVYGGGYGHSTSTTGNIGVTLGNATVYGDIYGGSALGSVNASTSNTTTITIGGNALHGTIYGGGMGSGTGDATRAVSNGNVQINYNTANAGLTGLYGGANVNGQVAGNIELNVNANVGASGNGNSINIFGGGYGAATATGGNVNVTVGNATGSIVPVVYGDIYGGSALGNVNDAAADITTVNFLNGTLHGNLYGGGLGDAQNAAKVNGQVVVNISNTTQTAQNCHIDLRDASIYGGNNTNGSPQDNITVNVYKTAYNYSDYASGDNYTAADGAHPYYAIDQVFGGGNQADYAPEDGLASSTKKTTVHIYGCDNTVRRVFGGGNAAAAVGLVTIIDGGRFDYVFGGGNGETSAANIGAGGTNLQVHGGNIRTLFGGSNTSGTITGQMRVNVDGTGACASDMYIAEFFCGNNLAPIGTQQSPTNINATIGCDTRFGDVYGGCNLADIWGNVTLTIVGGTMNNVYGGSKGRAADPANNITAQAADIHGNVTLNIHGGLINQNAYGGSNINGNITGSITVDMDWSQASSSCNNPANLHVGNVYGASNLAAYTPTTPGNYPAVSIKHGTVSGSVFGGGKGASAVVTSNPVVTVGDLTSGHEAYLATIVGDVYGGGDAAAVTGYTTVLIQKSNTVAGNAYGGGNAAAISGSATLTMTAGTVGNLYGGGNAAGVGSTATVNMNGGTVTTGIYGGCNSTGTIAGAVAVNINGGTVGTNATSTANVHGGGYGSSTATGDNVTVTIGNGTSTPVVWGDVYGGSALGNVNDATAEITKVWLKSGTINGCLYGGGLGDATHPALVNGKVQVVVDGGEVKTTTNNQRTTGAVFGCNNVNGTPKSTVEVTINSTVASTMNGENKVYALQGVYGGGNLAHFDPTTPGNYPTVTINGCGTSIKDVFGGGNAAAVPYTYVTINGGDIDRVFAGGNGESGTPANVGYKNTAATPTTDSYGTGTATVLITDGTINHVFAGSNANGTIRGGGNINVERGATNCGLHIGEIYGGGNLANGNAGTINIGCTGAQGEGIGDVYGGANQANVGNNITLNITGGSIQRVFGGNNTSGTISGTITVNVEWNSSNCYKYLGSVFGGGNLAEYSGSPVVNIKNGTVSGNVFGGGNGDPNDATQVKGSTGTPTVTIGDLTNNAYQAIVTGDVYGGGNAAKVTGNTSVKVQKANTTVGNAYGGGNAAPITGTTLLTMDNGTAGNLYGGGNAAGVGSTATVNMNGGTVTTGIYGGCNSTGDITGAVAVNINGGTIGSSSSAANIHGGGFGQNTTTSNNVEVTIGSAVGAQTYPTIYGDVYGGSALGKVNGTSVNTNLHTYVTMNAGTINGSLYGGALGDNSVPANVYAPVTVTVNSGTITGEVYGCNNVNGAPQSTVTVDINGTDMPQSGYALGKVFGGGNHAAYSGTPVVTVHNCDNSIEYVYGGGNAASVAGTNVTIYGGNEIGNVFGGCYGADVTTSGTLVKIYGGKIGKVFGGSNSSGTITGAISVTVDKTTETGHNSCNIDIAEVYGGGNMAASSAGTLNIGCADHIGSVYGGSNDANITGNILLNITSGHIDNVFGGNNTGHSITGTITVNIDDAQNSCGMEIGNVYGGGNMAAYTYAGNYPVVNIKKGTITGDVFGGGYGGTATVTANPQVVLTGGSITGRVFGGGALAPVTGNPTVTAQSGSTTTAARLYGGGLGSTAVVTGNTTVDVSGGTFGYVFGGGEAANQTGDVVVNIKGGTVTNDVYGGGALANTNTAGNKTTTVNLTGGTMKNAYGGGLGDATTEALVYGNVAVNLNSGVAADSKGAVVTDYLFGCNNINGSPKGSVTVHVYATQNSATGSILIKNQDSYDMKGVYGGGNMAAYKPTTSATATNVIIEGCGLSSIEYVYGGGNAAPVPATVVDIYGSYQIGSVFGGGNGKDQITVNGVLTDNPGADVGIYKVDYDTWNLPENRDLKYTDNSPNHDKGDDYYILYGSTAGQSIIGTTHVTFYGGNITHLFGGSNTKGDIVKEAKVILGDEDLKTCEFNVGDVYGGSNEAYMSGTSNIDMNCTDGMGQIYGGSRMADVHNDIVLTITGGHYQKVFGGNNLSGRIYGSITVNIEQTGCLPIEIDELYGGGNEAAYSVYGYDGNTPIEGNENDRLWADPQINIKSFKSIGTVFGGGYGATADVIGNPTININTVEGWTNGDYQGKNTDPEHPDPHAEFVGVKKNLGGIGEIGTVFGGGNQAIVKGDTYINIGTQDQVTIHNVSKEVYNAIKDSRNAITTTGQTDIANPGFTNQDEDNVTKDLTITVDGVNITGNVYGGGNQADVTGSTHVIVGKEQQEVEPQQQGGGSPAPRRTEQEPAQNNNQQQPQQPQTNAATESQQTRSLNATRQ